MSKSLRRRGVTRFGEFEADLWKRLLRKQGQPIDIQEKPFEILEALLEKAGEIVSRDKLCNRLWPGVRHGDMDHRLDVCMTKLRHALSDSAKIPRYIKTISTHGYCLVAPVEVKPEGQPKQRSAGIRIAVLPFGPWETTPEQCYVSDGLAAEISIYLGHLYPDQIRVIAHSSILRYRHSTKSPAQIGHELKVDYILETSAQMSRDHLHITAQLLRVKDQTCLWAQTYQYSVGDPLTIQNEVAERVARSLGLRLLPARSAIPQERRIQSVEAHRLYLKGCHYQRELSEESLRKSIECLERAVQLDSDSAAACSALANSYSILGLLGFSGPPKQCFPKATEAARASLRLNSNLAGSHVSLAIVKYLYEWDWPGSDNLLRRALQLNPSDAVAHRVLGYLLSSQRKHKEAIAEAWQASEFDPVSLSANVCLGAAYYLGRRFDEAIAILRTVLDIKPTSGPALMWLGACYTMKSMHAEAISALEKAREHLPDIFVEAWIGSAYARAGRKRAAEGVLARMARLSATNYVPAFCFALVRAGLGQMDPTFDWLVKACEERSPLFAVLLPVDPRLDFLRSDPRYETLVNHLISPTR